MKILRQAFVLALAVAFLALPAAGQPDTGSADFSSFVALGDSLSHGFTNGGVFEGVQVNSIPAIIARQAGVTDFQQPTISAPGIPGLLQLVSLVPGPVIVPRPGNGAPTNLNLPRPYNNLAVAGFDVHDVLATVSNNPLTDTVLRLQAPAAFQALALQPTFAYVWIGANDALGAATSGIVIDGVTLTSLDNFEADYRALVGLLAGAGAQLVIANVPDVTVIPFVTTIPPILVDPATNQPVIIGGQVVPLIGPDGPLNPATDRVLLTASTLLRQGFGIPVQLGGNGQPLPDQVVLNGGEIAAINDRIAGFNNIIRTVANEVGAAFLDANSVLRDIAANGINVGGIDFDTSFLTGGIIGYDGVHPTPLGYALTANFFIDAINERYDADIPPVNLFPFIFGPDGSAGTTLTVPPSAVVFSNEAAALVRNGLGVPDPNVLAVLKQRLEDGEPILGVPSGGTRVRGGLHTLEFHP